MINLSNIALLMLSICTISDFADGNNTITINNNGGGNPNGNGPMMMPPAPPGGGNCNSQPASNGPDIPPGTYAQPGGGTIYTTGTNKHPDFSPVDCNGMLPQVYPQISYPDNRNGGNGGGFHR